MTLRRSVWYLRSSISSGHGSHELSAGIPAETNRQTDSLSARQTDKHRQCQTNRQTHSDSARQTDKHTQTAPDKQTNTLRQCQTNRQTHSDSARQTDKHTQTVPDKQTNTLRQCQINKHSQTVPDKQTNTLRQRQSSAGISGRSLSIRVANRLIISYQIAVIGFAYLPAFLPIELA